MNKKYGLLTLLILVLVISSLSWMILLNNNGTGNSTLNDGPIEIGVFAPLSGEAAIYGQSIKNGLDIAREDINEKGGILGREVKLTYQDTHLDSKEAVSAMNKFIHVDGMSIVIAAEGSGATSAAVPLADQTKTLTMVAIASTPTLKDAGDYVFRVIPSDTYQGVEIVKLVDRLDLDSVAILYVNDEFGLGIKNIVERDFNNIVEEESFEASSVDFKTQLTKIKSKNTDAIVVVARKEYPNILKQIEELSIDSRIITSAEFKDESLVEASGESSEGVLVPFYAETIDYVDYKEKFKSKYGKEPSLFSDYGYDALMVIAKAAEKTNSIDSTKLKNQLYGITYNGATGIVKFDKDGEVYGKPFVFYEIRNGEFVELSV